MKMLLRFSLLISFSLVAPAQASDTIRVTQSYCADGTFKTEVEGVGPSLPAQGDNCIALSSATARSATTLRFIQKGSLPTGNSIDFVLKNLLRNDTVKSRDLKMPQAKEYFVRFGRCRSKSFYIVEDAKNLGFPVLYTADQSATVSQCRFDSVHSARLKSDTDISGVYSSDADTSYEQFIAIELGR